MQKGYHYATTHLRFFPTTDWLLYWQASEAAEAGKITRTSSSMREKLESNNNATTQTPISSPQTPPPPQNEPYTDDEMKIESNTSSSTPPNTSASNEIPSSPKPPNAYYPHLLLLGLLLQLTFSAWQFQHFRTNGLPGFVARWPVLYAASAPSVPCLYARGCVQLAPLRWPWIGERVARWGEMGVVGLWVGWSLGVWAVFRYG